MNYKVFYLLAMRLFNKEIQREQFIAEWSAEQKRQGITPRAQGMGRGQEARACTT